jgi:AcrR family transcriptional regulator
MVTPSNERAPRPRRRPKDRAERIAGAASMAFSQQGYHAASMADIAHEVGVTAGALYHHAPSKYHLFRDAVLAFGQQLLDATAFADSAHRPGEAGPIMRALIDATAQVAIDRRAECGLYRWESRFLNEEDYGILSNQYQLLMARIDEPLALLRPRLAPHRRTILILAALSVLGSICDHQTPLASSEVHACITDMATNMLTAKLPGSPSSKRAPAEDPTVSAAAGTFEVVVHHAMRLFHEYGYHQTSVENIAAAAEIPATVIYEYFSGKSEILTVAYWRGVDRQSSELSRIVSTIDDPRLALGKLIDNTLDHHFDDIQLAFVLHAERINLPAREAQTLSNMHRSTIDAWAKLLHDARPTLTLGRARYVIHGALSLIVDPGRTLQRDDRATAKAGLHRLMTVAVFGTDPTHSRRV